MKAEVSTKETIYNICENNLKAYKYIAFDKPISQLSPKVNRHGIRCSSIVEPKARPCINDWFEKFSVNDIKN